MWKAILTRPIPQLRAILLAKAHIIDVCIKNTTSERKRRGQV
jgi:hypothetical protein